MSSKNSLVVSSYRGAMLGSRERSKMADLWDRLVTVPGDIPAGRSMATAMGLDPACASFHVRKLQAGTTYPLGAELLAEVTVQAAKVRRTVLAHGVPWYARQRGDNHSPTA